MYQSCLLHFPFFIDLVFAVYYPSFFFNGIIERSFNRYLSLVQLTETLSRPIYFAVKVC